MQQHQNKQATTAAPASDTPLLDKMLDQAVTYKPFMGNDDITLSPRIVLQYFAAPTKSGQKPSKEQAAKFVRLCQSRGLNPWEGDAFLVGYDTKDGPVFNLITAHQSFLKRAEVHAEYNGMESGVTVKLPSGELVDQQGDYVGEGQTLVAGWARVHFKHRAVPTYRRLKLATFNQNRSRWNVDPAGMIVKCAEADALRSSFPTSLGGMYLQGEMDSQRGYDEKRDPIPMPRAIDEPPPIPAETVLAATETEEPQDEPPADTTETISEAVAFWRDWLAKEPTLEQLNANLPELSELEAADKKVVKAMVMDYATKHGWKIPKGASAFVPA